VTTTETKSVEKWAELARRIGDAHNADVILYSGAIEDDNVDELIRVVKRSTGRTPRRSNVILLLATRGGSADAAFRLARCLQNRYRHFTLFVYGRCKSAGTLIAIGAHELVLADFGEFGPLDVQLGKNDELFEEVSGLNITQALNSLNTRTHNYFTEILLTVRSGSRGQISTKLAAEIASRLAIGVYERIYSQIDPGQLGAMERAMHIASDYGERLKSPNVKPGTIDRLISGYSSHAFVIDLKEAKTLFHKVRNADRTEEELGESIDHIVRDQTDTALVHLLNAPEEVSNETTAADAEPGSEGTEAGIGPDHTAASEAAAATDQAPRRTRPKVVVTPAAAPSSAAGAAPSSPKDTQVESPAEEAPSKGAAA